MDIKDFRGETPLFHSCRSNLVRSAKCLVGFGSDVNARDKTRRTPLHQACASQSIRCMRYLLSSHASIYACDDEDNSPLHVASASSRLNESLRELLKFQSDDEMLRQGWLDGQNIDGRTALHEASCDGNAEGVKMLLAAGASDTIVDESCRTALHVASSAGSIECVKAILLHSKKTLNELDANDSSALHLASEAGYKDIARELLEAGAHVDARDRFGRTSCWLASRHGHDDTVRVLYGVGGADVNLGNTNQIAPVHVAALHLHDRTLQILTEGNADLNARTANRQSLLHILASSRTGLKDRARQIEIAEMLRSGMSKNAQSWKDSKGRTASSIAIMMGWSVRDAKCVFQ